MSEKKGKRCKEMKVLRSANSLQTLSTLRRFMAEMNTQSNSHDCAGWPTQPATDVIGHPTTAAAAVAC